MHAKYAGMFVASVIMTMVGMLFFNIIVPILNRKNPGQSLGKMMLKITPVFEQGANVPLTIVKRELPISILQTVLLS
jgi:uncharacterized RDD family membrane protein YckC